MRDPCLGRPTPFVPVAAGSPGRRGLHRATTARLIELRDRYRGLRDDPASSPALRDYSRGLLREIGAELRRRQPAKAVA